MDAVIYIRWSSAIQSQGSSLERQRTDCRGHAEKMGWNVVEEMVDDGVYEETVAGVGKAMIARELNREGLRPSGRLAGGRGGAQRPIREGEMRSISILSDGNVPFPFRC